MSILSGNEFWQNAANYGTKTTSGVDDLAADPLFVSPGTGDYRLHAASPARVDSGETPGVDRGALAFVGSGSAPTDVTVTPSASGVTVGWETNGSAGYFLSMNHNGGPYAPPIDVRTGASYTIPAASIGTGTVQFAVSSHDAHGNESPATYTAVYDFAPPPPPEPAGTGRGCCPRDTELAFSIHERACRVARRSQRGSPG